MHSLCIFRRFVLLLALLIATAASASWQPLSPVQANVNQIVADESGQRIAVSTVYAGVWISADGGAHWTPTGESPYVSDLDGSAPVQFIDATGDTILAGARLSTDGGLNWRSLPEPVSEARLVRVSPTHHHLWAAVADSGLFVSSDYGQSWTPASQIPDAVGLYLDPALDNILYSWTTLPYRGGCCPPAFVSHDRGISWDTLYQWNVQGADIGLISGFTKLTDGTLLMVGVGSSVLATVDDGLHWTVRSDIPDTIAAGRRIVQDRFLPDNIYATGRCPGGLWRSQNLGAQWQPAGNGLPLTRELGRDLCQNPYSGDLYLVLGSGGVFRSTDHGESWVSISQPPIAAPGKFRAAREAVFFDNQWQLESSADWSRIPPLPARQDTVIMNGPEFCYRHGDQLAAYAACDVSARNSDFGQMVFSADNGQHWSFGNPMPAQTFFHQIFVYEDETMTRIAARAYNMDGDRPLYLSDDGGQTWSSQTESPYDIVSLGAQAIYGIGYTEDGRHFTMARTLDGGMSWEDLAMPEVLADTVPVALGYGDQLFIVAGHRALLRQDGLWTERNPVPMPDLMYLTWQFSPGPSPWIIAWDERTAEFWASDDLGLSWMHQSVQLSYGPLTLHPTALTCDSYRNRLWVSTEAGPWYFDLSELASVKSDPAQPANYTILSTYPNPFNSEARIVYDLEQSGHVNLALYNLEGRLVRTLADEVQQSGRHELRLDGSGLASGTYFLKLKSPAAERTGKILLLK